MAELDYRKDKLEIQIKEIEIKSIDIQIYSVFFYI